MLICQAVCTFFAIMGTHFSKEYIETKTLCLQISIFWLPSCLMAAILLFFSRKKLFFAEMILHSEIIVMIMMAIIINHTDLIEGKNEIFR